MNDQKQCPTQWRVPPPHPAVGQETLSKGEIKDEAPKWGWGAQRRERRERRLDAVQQAWTERKDELASMKAQADEKV